MDPIRYLAYRAEVNRTEIAAISRGQPETFHSLSRHVRIVAARLREAGVAPGDTVAVYIADQYLHYVAALAVFHEGATQISGDATYSRLPQTVRVDAYVTDRLSAFSETAPTIEVTREWLDGAAPASGIRPRAYPDRSTPARIETSSGTTGAPKAIPLTMAQFWARAAGAASLNPPAGPSLTPMGMGAGWGFRQALGGLIAGNPVVFSALRTAEDVLAIKTYRVASLVGSVHHINQIMDHVEERGVTLPSLRFVQVGAAAASPQLAQRAQTLLCPNLLAGYGSSECGVIALASAQMLTRMPGVTGIPAPDAVVEIVGEDDAPLSPGKEGAVRIRTPSMASGYLGDPEATARSFRNGWFYPGDLGRMSEAGVLTLTGRLNEVINVGGGKVDPGEIDAFLAEIPGVREAAAFAMADAGGIDRVWAAVVADEIFDEAAARRACDARFGSKAPQRIVRVAALPRNRLGKVVRRELAALASGAQT